MSAEAKDDIARQIIQEHIIHIILIRRQNVRTSERTSEYSTYGKREKEYESGDSEAGLIRREMNVRVELVEENVPVRAFVSIVRRTRRIITKLENLLPLLRIRDC